MMKSTGPSGYIAIDKPGGITSFDVIRELRRQLRIKKLGHSGVLDKPATGVLVVGANRATRLFELFSGFEKEYQADIWLGLTTNTDDLTGELANASDGNATTEQAFSAALEDYLGTIDQIPPAFSLTKIGGKELYRYALAGEEVEVAPKRVTVISCQLDEFRAGIPASEAIIPDSKLTASAGELGELACARVSIRCVGGVYVRSLARDIGADLGVGGCLGRLVRTRVGPFRLDAALSLDEVATRMGQGEDVANMLQPLAVIASDDSRLNLDAAQLKMVRDGRSIRRFKHHLPAAAGKQGDIVYGMDPGNDLVVILSVADMTQHGLVELKPLKVLG